MNDKMLIKQLKANHSELIIEENQHVFWVLNFLFPQLTFNLKKLQCP